MSFNFNRTETENLNTLPRMVNSVFIRVTSFSLVPFWPHCPAPKRRSLPAFVSLLQKDQSGRRAALSPRRPMNFCGLLQGRRIVRSVSAQSLLGSRSSVRAQTPALGASPKIASSCLRIRLCFRCRFLQDFGCDFQCFCSTF